MRITILVATSLLSFVAACDKKDGPAAPAAPAAPTPAPAAPTPPPVPAMTPKDRATLAAAAFKAGLMSELSRAVAEIGPAGAIGVCGLAAVTAKTAVSGPDLLLGRTSRKLRNPKNTAPQWVAAAMDLIEKQPPNERAPVEVPVPPGVGVYTYAEPLVVQPMCLQCHGTDLKDDVKKALAARYPEDQATGYKEGDLRGVLWVEVKVKP